MVGNMNKWKDEPSWANESVNTHPKEFKDSVWASGDRKSVHDEPVMTVKNMQKKDIVVDINDTGMIGL